MSSDHDERVADEVALVQAMYPEQITWDAHSRELTFKGTNSAITLRLPDDYLTTGRPIVLTAFAGKRDISGLFGSKGFSALAGPKKGPSMFGKSSGVGKSVLMSAADGSGFQFSPLKRSRKNLDDTLRG